MNLSFVMYLAQPSPVDMLVLVGKVSCAAWLAVQWEPAARVSMVCLAFRVGQLVLRVEWRTASSRSFDCVCGSSAQAPSCWHERRRQTSWAAAAGGLAECMRQLRWWRAAAMLATSADPPPPPCVRRRASRDAGGGGPVPAHRRVLAPDYLYPDGHRAPLCVCGTRSRVARGGDGLLLVEVHLRFANVDSRPIRVRRAS